MGARAFFVASLVVGLSAVLCIAAPAGNQVPPQELVQHFLGDYCMECHDAYVQKSGRTVGNFALPLQSEVNVIEATENLLSGPSPVESVWLNEKD